MLVFPRYDDRMRQALEQHGIRETYADTFAQPDTTAPVGVSVVVSAASQADANARIVLFLQAIGGLCTAANSGTRCRICGH